MFNLPVYWIWNRLRDSSSIERKCILQIYRRYPSSVHFCLQSFPSSFFSKRYQAVSSLNRLLTGVSLSFGLLIGDFVAHVPAHLQIECFAHPLLTLIVNLCVCMYTYVRITPNLNQMLRNWSLAISKLHWSIGWKTSLDGKHVVLQPPPSYFFNYKHLFIFWLLLMLITNFCMLMLEEWKRRRFSK